MPSYRVGRNPSGSYHVQRNTWEEEAADTVLIGGAKAAGWLIGSGIAGLGSLARRTQDRRLQMAAADLEAASECGDDALFLQLAQDFTRRWPQFEEGHAALADALQRHGRNAEALGEVEKAVALGLDERRARMLRVDIYEDAGQSGKAIQELSVLARDPDPELRQISLLQRARLLMNIGDLPRALADANDALSVQPDEYAYLLRGHVYRAMHDYDRTIEDYTRAIALSPDEPALLENRAEVYEEMGRAPAAQKDRGAAARITAGHRPAPADLQPSTLREEVRARKVRGRLAVIFWLLVLLGLVFWIGSSLWEPDTMNRFFNDLF